MGILTEDMQRVVREQRLGFIATVCPDGTPNLSPKGTTAVWDDNHLYFVDIASSGTAANLRSNPGLAINIVDVVTRRGYRFKGAGQYLTAGPVFDAMLARRQANGSPLPVRGFVLMRVEEASEIWSPAYDLGRDQADIRAEWLAYWAELHGSGR